MKRTRRTGFCGGAIFAGLVILAGSVEAARAQLAPVEAARWSTYADPRHGYRLDVPSMFRPDPPPPPSDETGRTFQTPDGRARLTVFGAPRDGKSLDELKEGYLDKAGSPDVTYTRRFGRSLVLSGYQGDDIFYMKIIAPRGPDVVYVLELKYPREMKRPFDAVVTRMSRSFRRM